MSLKPTKAELANPRGISAEGWLRLYNWKPASQDIRRVRTGRLRALKLRQQISQDYEDFITRSGKHSANVIILPRNGKLLERLYRRAA